MEMNNVGGRADGTGSSYLWGPKGIFRHIDPVKNRAPLEALKYPLIDKNIYFAISIRKPLTGRARKFVYI